MEESILKLVTLQFLDGPTFLLIYTVGLGICIFASTQVRAILVKAIHAPALSSV